MKTTVWVLLFLCSTMLFGEVLFYDDFDRNEGEAVGNGWTNIGPVNPIIENGGMKVVSNSLQGVRRDFSTLGISSGIYYVSWDWKIGSNNWLADAFPNGTITYLRHDYEGSLYYDNTSDFSNPIQIGSLAFDTWANFKLKANLGTDRFSIWINNTLLADNIAGLAVSDFTRFTFRAGSGSAVTQYIDNFIIYNDITPAIPTNLTAVGDVNNISLSWNGNPQDFLTYRIYRGTSSPATTFLAEVQSPQTSYVDNTAAANIDYFYRVKAVSLGTIESGFSNEVMAHLQPDISVTPQVIDITVGQGYTGEMSFTIANNGNYPLEWRTERVVPTDGLVGYYPFNGNANDFSGNNNNGIVYNATLTTDRFNNNDSAYLFDGSGDYIRFTNLFPFHETGDATISFWMKRTDTAKRTMLWSRTNSSDTDRYHFYTGETGQGFELDYRTPSGTLRLYTGTHDFIAPMQEWVNIIVKRIGNQYHLYRNGVFMKTDNDTNPYLPTSAGWVVGSCLGTHSADFLGSLDDVLLYNRALSDAEINMISQSTTSSFFSINPNYGNLPIQQQTQIVININALNLSAGVYSDTLCVNSNDPDTPSISVIVNLIVAPGEIVVAPTEFTIELNAAVNTSNTSFNITNTGLGVLNYKLQTSGNNVLPSGLSCYYPFNGNANDESGNNLNGTVYGPTLTSDRFLYLESAFSFDGNNDFVRIGDPVPPVLQFQTSLSISAWIKVMQYPSTSSLWTIAGCQYDGSTAGYSLQLDGRPNSDGQPSPQGHLHFNIGNGSWHISNANSQVPLNEWVHVAVTRNQGEAANFYINGVLQPSTSAAWTGSIIYNNTEWNIGRQKDMGGRFFNGNIDDVMVFNHVLSQSEIEDMYNISSPFFITLNPTAGTIHANANINIDVSINAATLPVGVYNENIIIISNDPSSPYIIPYTIKVDFTPPLVPAGLTFDEVQSDMNQIYLSWTANALADSVYSYKIYRRGLHDTLWALKGTVDAEQTWFIDNQFTGLDTTAVYYKITAVDWVDNESTASEEVLAWLQRFPAPTGLNLEIIRDRHVKLSWNPVTQTISGNSGTPLCYVIYRSYAPSPLEDFYFVGAVDDTTFTHNWAAWFIEQNKQFYLVTAYSGSFEDIRAVAESHRDWKYGELDKALKENGVVQINLLK